jgi:hypothetical protein
MTLIPPDELRGHCAPEPTVRQAILALEIAMTLKIKLTLSDDKRQLTVDVPDQSVTLLLAVQEIAGFIQHLAWMRANMEPPIPSGNLTPQTPVQKLPAIKWSVVQDEIPGQCRLFLLHPGYGWIWIPLTREHLDQIREIGLKNLLSEQTIQ